MTLAVQFACEGFVKTRYLLPFAETEAKKEATVNSPIGNDILCENVKCGVLERRLKNWFRKKVFENDTFSS